MTLEQSFALIKHNQRIQTPFVSNFAKVLREIKESVKQFMDSRVVTDKKTEVEYSEESSMSRKHIRDRCAKSGVTVLEGP